MNCFTLHFYEAEGIFAEGDAELIVIPTVHGEYGVQANHWNEVVGIVPGLLKFKMKDGEKKYVAVSTGMMRVEDNDVLVLVETAEYPEDIDERRALEELDAAKERMLQKKSIKDSILAEAALRRAISRIKVKKGYR